MRKIMIMLFAFIIVSCPAQEDVQKVFKRAHTLLRRITVCNKNYFKFRREARELRSMSKRYRKKGDVKKADRFIGYAKKKDGNAVAMIEYMKRCRKEGIEKLTRVINQHGKIAKAYRLRALYYFYGNNYKKGMEDINTAIKINPKNMSYVLERGLVYQKRKQYQNAYNDFEACINQNFKVKLCNLWMIQLALALQQWRKALKHVNFCLEHKLKVPQNIFIKAKIYAYLEEYDNAIYTLQKGQKYFANLRGKKGERYKREYKNLAKNLFISKKQYEQELQKREKEKGTLPLIAMHTAKGTVTIELFQNDCPITTEHFLHLIEKNIYSTLPFQQVRSHIFQISSIDNKIRRATENKTRPHYRGSLILNKDGSSFFITKRHTFWLEKSFLAFGRVVKGMKIVDSLTLQDKVTFKILKK